MMILLINLITFAHATPVVFFEDLQNFKNKNLNFQTEQQNLKASEDLLLSRQLFWTPKLSISANQNQTRTNAVTTFEGNSLNADLTWNLFRGGPDWHKMKDAKAQKKAQELQIQNEELRIEVKASDLIFKSLYLNETERIQKELLKLKEESLKIVKDRYHQGKLPLQEVTKSEIDLLQQKNKLRSANLDSLENKSQISSSFIENIKTKEWPFSEETALKLPSSLNMPLIEQKYWSSQAREENWKATKGLYWPSLDLSIQYQTFPVGNRTNNQWVGLLSLSIPIWNQYETSANISSAYAQYLGALNDYQDTDQTLKQRSLFLKIKIESARLNLSEAKKNLETSRQLYLDLLKSFRLGRMSINDLFLEQNRLLESENALTLSQLTFHQSLIETCALLGLNSSNCL